MKNFKLLYIIPTLLILILTGCKTQQKMAQKETVKTQSKNITFQFESKNCDTKLPLFLFEFDGYGFVPVQQSNVDTNNTYTFSVPASEHQFYFLGANPKQTKPIILGKENNLTLQGSCNNIRKSAFTNSPINVDYEMAITQIRGYQSKANNLNRQFSRTSPGSETHTEILDKLKKNDLAQMALLNEMRARHPFVGKIVATKTYLSYAHNKGNYENEVQYYINEFFAHLDLSDVSLDRMPALFETFRDYTTTLTAVRLDRPQMKKTLDGVLGKMNSDSKAYRFALGAIVQTLQGKNHPAFIDYGNLFVQKYGAEKHEYLTVLKKSTSSAKSFLIGAVAPDFEQNTPEGNPMKLSDFRGKVVLVDFWASWCGPCRKENPNVVKLYNKYKSQGFEVLGVSLDKTKDKWLKAIEKDKLTWSHVSDLRGWSNAVAKQYSVRSIPHTILLDKDGKIIARNMRGEELASKLREIFGK